MYNLKLTWESYLPEPVPFAYNAVSVAKRLHESLGLAYSAPGTYPVTINA